MRLFHLVFSILMAAVTVTAQEIISPQLEEFRARYNMPGLAAIAFTNGQIAAQGAAGVRRAGSNEPLTINDPLNIASCTKIMTATLAARLVERGKLRWDISVKEIFPAYKSFDPAFHNTTLEQLLANRAGVQQGSTFEKRYWAALMSRKGSIGEVRRWVAETVLKDQPEVAPGTYLYSNQGYAVAAVMMEIVTGKTWEELMKEEIFIPLKMTTAKMGIVYDNEIPPFAPVGHDLPKDSTNAAARTAMQGVRHSRYQASHGPGGFVACTFADWGKFLRVHTTKGFHGYLKPESVEKLQKPFSDNGDYALGVNSVKRGWAKPGQALTHNGDIFGQNTVFWLAPANDLIVMVFTNCRSADNSTSQAMDAAASLLVKRFGN